MVKAENQRCEIALHAIRPSTRWWKASSLPPREPDRTTLPLEVLLGGPAEKRWAKQPAHPSYPLANLLRDDGQLRPGARRRVSTTLSKGATTLGAQLCNLMLGPGPTSHTKGLGSRLVRTHMRPMAKGLMANARRNAGRPHHTQQAQDDHTTKAANNNDGVSTLLRPAANRASLSTSSSKQG